ncbi:hypothetical protein ACQVSN_08345 [Bacillus mobilis]|uniref:hypothetical protein n=1 Tax=Bacillus mobilis TaxID=2026190 RepID=UPI0021D2EDF7|nr:hypothetical protein [Bacillus mobilis]MCU5198215.1 hypothetical protein [Bacillus mobilis]
MKKTILFTFLIGILVSTFTLHVQFAQAVTQEQPWRKYPDNADKTFKDVNKFYNSISQENYIEYQNAKMNIREKVFFKDVNTVLARADKYGPSRVGGEGYHPKRQVYVFVSVSFDGNSKSAVFDAETGRMIAKSESY